MKTISKPIDLIGVLEESLRARGLDPRGESSMGSLLLERGPPSKGKLTLQRLLKERAGMTLCYLDEIDVAGKRVWLESFHQEGGYLDWNEGIRRGFRHQYHLRLNARLGENGRKTKVAEINKPYDTREFFTYRCSPALQTNLPDTYARLNKIALAPTARLDCRPFIEELASLYANGVWPAH